MTEMEKAFSGPTPNNGTDQADFAALFEKSYTGHDRLEPGQQVEAVVVRITGDSIFLGLGGKSEGYIATKEMRDKDGNLTVTEGDVIRVYFLSAKNNEMLFTAKLSGSKAANTHLEEAFRNHIPVEGTVDKEIKGGFEVKIGGTVRAFCPFSQIDLRRASEPAEYIGNCFSFHITEYRENGRNIILSRRRLLEEERQMKKEDLKASMREGDIVKGIITSIRNFGAFVDLGGIEGLIPISEIGWGRVENISQVLSEGQEVEVTALKLDWDNERYSFSLKNAMADPWETVPLKYPEGSCHMGKVARITAFGAFVTLEPGVDGLIHISNLGSGRRINHPREVTAEGKEMEVRITSIDLKEKRLSLSLPDAKGDDQEKDETEAVKHYIQKQKKEPDSMGTFGELLKRKMK